MIADYVLFVKSQELVIGARRRDKFKGVSYHMRIGLPGR